MPSSVVCNALGGKMQAIINEEGPRMTGPVFEVQQSFELADEVWRLVEESRKRLDAAKDKRLILLVGATGAGKSTLVNILNGSEMVYAGLPDNMDGEQFLQVKSGETVYAEIGHNARRSKTLHPQAVPAVFEPPAPAMSALTYVDLPGSNDAHLSEEERLCASFALPMAIHQAEAINGIIVVIDIESFATRGKSFSDFINLLGGLLDPGIIMGAESSASPLIFVFTHVNKRKFRTVSAILSHIDQIKTERSAEMRVMVQSLMPSLQVIANKLNRTDELLAVLETTQAFAQSPEDASQAYPVFFTLVKGLLEAYKSALQENDADYCRAQKHYTELSDAYYELIALSIILKYKDSPRNHFIIDGEVGDDRQILLDHIQRLSECAPIDKANFVFQGRAGEEWLQLDKLLQETAEKAAALKQTLEECPKEVVAIKKYHGFLKAQHKEHMAILNMLQTNQESNIEDISNELTARDAMLMQYLGRELEDRRTRQEELQTELEVLDTAEPMRHLHPALGPFDFSVSELRRWASFGMGCLADSVFLAPLLATTVVGSIAGRLAVLINEIIGDSDSEVIMRAAMMPALMLVSPRYFFLEKMLGIAHDFVYHDLPFVKAELHPNSVVEKYPEHPGLRGRDTFAWMTRGNCRNAFYSDTIVEDKEKGIFKISGYFDNSDVHIKLYVEKRIHPDIKPRIELLRQQLERLQYATSQYFQAHTNEHEAEHEALIACSVAVDKKSALIDFLGRSIARYQTRISQLNGYLYEYKSSIRNAEHEWHAHVVSCLETLDMVYEVVGSQREFVKNLLTEAKEFSTQSALQAVTHPLTIWGRKATPEQAIEYQLKGKKEAGSSIGATYHPADKPDATWIGKLGLRELTDEEMPGIQGTQVYHGRAIEALKEKIASDFYILLSEGTYGVPKTRLAEIPLESLRSAYGARDYYELITAPLNHQRVDNRCAPWKAESRGA